ncbi:MAG: DUF4340 domain-containing protein [Pseudomonadota bacterium]
MTKLIRWLAVLLVLQLGLVVGLNLTQTDLSAPPSQRLLISIGDIEIDQLTITDAQGEQVNLRKKEGSWIIPIDGDFPADQEKVENFLQRLLELQRGLPIGTTPAALRRFMVEENNFERRITLLSNEKLIAEIFLGTSPRARMAHARSSKDASVFEINLATYEAPVKSEEWQDERVVQVPYPDIDAIDVPGVISLVRNRSVDTGTDTTPTTERWGSVELGPGESIQQDGADTLAKSISVLRVIDVLGKDMKTIYELTPPQLTLVVKTITDATVVYELGAIEGEDDYVLKASTRPEYFRVPSHLAKSLVRATDRDVIVLKQE